MPVLPLTSVRELPNILQSFRNRTAKTESLPRRPAVAWVAKHLLPHCTLGHPLPTHTVRILSDINSSLSDLLDKTIKPEGQAMLTDYIGTEAEHIIQFWASKDDAGNPKH